MQLVSLLPVVHEQLDGDNEQVQVHYTGKRITFPVVNIVLPDGAQYFVYAYDLIAASDALKAALANNTTLR